jgi:hypothetical protein
MQHPRWLCPCEEKPWIFFKSRSRYVDTILWGLALVVVERYYSLSERGPLALAAN